MSKKSAKTEPTGAAANGFGGILMDDTVALMDSTTAQMADNDTEASLKPGAGKIVRP